MWYVYILRCKDNSLYTGITTNLDKRVKSHNAGKASKYTRTRRPVELVHREELANKSLARRREIQIKDFRREKKEELIRGCFPRLYKFK